jgi:cobalt-zinc-cadmium resistance protein CzcA
LERLIEVKSRLPAGIERVVVRVTTGLGEVYQYYLDGPQAAVRMPAQNN